MPHWTGLFFLAPAPYSRTAQRLYSQSKAHRSHQHRFQTHTDRYTGEVSDQLLDIARRSPYLLDGVHALLSPLPCAEALQGPVHSEGTRLHPLLELNELQSAICLVWHTRVITGGGDASCNNNSMKTPKRNQIQMV
ncbi:hypothetical protein EYF80_005760 [Liparis tanakae]|uniref:Uncharacterized protein n=1 Tax=Liparis tanakae TaxID=230148 RepID=A0A4Z2J100_9TELE|nr:hypothetical protein EYF80_005760 [Liparis tanakae]